MTKIKEKARYVCQQCGSVYQKWLGKCEDCGDWNSIVEETVSQEIDKGKRLTIQTVNSAVTQLPRISSGIGELDRVLGGGVVPGGVTLIAGDPGIGKSTLLLQFIASLTANTIEAIYVTGEESEHQIALRAKRLGVGDHPIPIIASTHVEDILATLSGKACPQLLIVDSIQTMMLRSIASSPGTITQVRGCTHQLVTFAKQHNMALFIVGHVTKEGQIAGPKLLEHMVDTVLYFEGDRLHQFRVLRAVKNRYGAVSEIGVFTMVDKGLEEVPNPSQLFLSDRDQAVSGCTVFAAMEGTRPMLVEVQALVSSSYLATPRRSVVGWDSQRLAMVEAILQMRYGVRLSDKDIYLNIAGGLKISEPAMDLSVAAILISSLLNIPLPSQLVVLGEIGLTGEVRQVSQLELRLKEAKKLGFTTALIPSGKHCKVSGLTVKAVGHVKQLAELFTEHSVE